MNKSKIEWCDHTWNPITGCRHNCSYCYAKRMTARFAGDVRLNLMAKKDYSTEPAADNSENVFILDKPMLNETGNTLVYPFGFEPTYHKYRMDYPEKLKMGNNIFVGAMADIFGKWVPGEWIRDVMETCLDNPIHNYLFLTKNPERYTEVGVPAGLENMWYGTTITCDADADRFNYLPAGCNTFVSIEPLMGDIVSIDEPVDWDNIRGIDELLVFERPLITPDYNSIYNHDPKTGKWSKFGKPEFYDVSPMYGKQFRVHESRCLLFKNGTLPQSSSRTEYRFFGMPEYTRIHKALQETVTSHGNGVKLLDRAVQAIYKMNDLANLLETDEGEDIVLRRLRIIDMAKGIINSIAIDANGEDYDYKTVTFSGVKDIIDATCNMLSAVTNIPQTKLFGRSPAGENSTGEGDMENYYSYVNKIQKLNLKRNLGVLIDIILIAGKYKGEFEEIPDYTLKFKPLWNLSEAEQAGVDQTKAATELTKAQTAQVYVDMQALDASEVRKRLAENGEFTVNDILDDEDDWEAMVDDAPVNANESAETSNTALSAETKAPKEQEETETDSATDTTIPTGCGVIVVKDGKVLVGTRKDNGLVCGPGGHIEIGETPEDAAIRETREEFGINIANIIPVTLISGMSEQYCPSQVFLCTEYYGNPICFNTEMEDARFEDVGSVLDMDLFLPFRLSLEDFLRQLDEIRLTAEVSQSNMEADGGPGSGRYPKGSGKKNEKSGSKKKKSQSLPMTAKEKAKVTHDINNVYHAKYKGKSSCYIRTHSNEPDSPAYVYRFRNHGFDDYEIYMKESTD